MDIASREGVPALTEGIDSTADVFRLIGKIDLTAQLRRAAKSNVSTESCEP
jgi:hypothetical protein